MFFASKCLNIQLPQYILCLVQRCRSMRIRGDHLLQIVHERVNITQCSAIGVRGQRKCPEAGHQFGAQLLDVRLQRIVAHLHRVRLLVQFFDANGHVLDVLLEHRVLLLKVGVGLAQEAQLEIDNFVVLQKLFGEYGNVVVCRGKWFFLEWERSRFCGRRRYQELL